VDRGAGPEPAVEAPGPAEPAGQHSHRAIEGDEADVVVQVAAVGPARPGAEDCRMGPAVVVGDGGRGDDGAVAVPGRIHPDLVGPAGATEVEDAVARGENGCGVAHGAGADEVVG